MLKGIGFVAAIACGVIMAAGGTSAIASALPALKPVVDAQDHIVEVRGGGGGGGGGIRGGGGSFRGGSVGGYRGGGYSVVPRVVSPHYVGPRHRPRTYFYAAPIVTYYGGYGSHCAYLAHQARSTGSPYWWRRYRTEC